jgi:hypothetical protein
VADGQIWSWDIGQCVCGFPVDFGGQCQHFPDEQNSQKRNHTWTAPPVFPFMIYYFFNLGGLDSTSLALLLLFPSSLSSMWGTQAIHGGGDGARNDTLYPSEIYNIQFNKINQQNNMELQIYMNLRTRHQPRIRLPNTSCSPSQPHYSGV